VQLQKFESVQNMVKLVQWLVDQTMLMIRYAWKRRNKQCVGQVLKKRKFLEERFNFWQKCFAKKTLCWEKYMFLSKSKYMVKKDKHKKLFSLWISGFKGSVFYWSIIQLTGPRWRILQNYTSYFTESIGHRTLFGGRLFRTSHHSKLSCKTRSIFCWLWL